MCSSIHLSIHLSNPFASKILIWPAHFCSPFRRSFYASPFLKNSTFSISRHTFYFSCKKKAVLNILMKFSLLRTGLDNFCLSLFILVFQPSEIFFVQRTTILQILTNWRVRRLSTILTILTNWSINFCTADGRTVQTTWRRWEFRYTLTVGLGGCTSQTGRYLSICLSIYLFGYTSISFHLSSVSIHIILAMSDEGLDNLSNILFMLKIIIGLSICLPYPSIYLSLSRLYSEEELPAEFKLYLPVQQKGRGVPPSEAGQAAIQSQN